MSDRASLMPLSNSQSMERAGRSNGAKVKACRDIAVQRPNPAGFDWAKIRSGLEEREQRYGSFPKARRVISCTSDHMSFIWRYFSCVSVTLQSDEEKGGVGKDTACCVDPREGLEPCHSSLSLHQLSLIAREDRIPRAQLFLILFGACEA
ncbi:unnamed protein product [Tetraodon nigroviridis]|uniref:(spotted green pufferfish) hypothetical protein n=1 Tax=Tetraodon nigroviridis TaxID=99883 RepID=Q4REU5_TETNG|nr:unnamed protein product [Tetraodon nigroviridis]